MCCGICKLRRRLLSREERRFLVTNNNKHRRALRRRADFKPTNSLAAACCVQLSFMLSLLFLFSLVSTLVFSARSPQIRGVHPSLLSQYKPKGTTWTCLDGNKTIPWSAVNDDYCDCIDGSDEPGIYIYSLYFSPESYKPY